MLQNVTFEGDDRWLYQTYIEVLCAVYNILIMDIMHCVCNIKIVDGGCYRVSLARL